MKFGSYSTLWGDNDGAILIDRNEEMLSAARKLSDFINTLNLPADQHNQLVELMIAQVLAAERNAFFEGGRLGVECGKYEAEHPELQEQE